VECGGHGPDEKNIDWIDEDEYDLKLARIENCIHTRRIIEKNRGWLARALEKSEKK